MVRLAGAAALTFCIAVAVPVRAQETRPTLKVRTFTLRQMRPGEAAQLVTPYAVSPGGGVFEAGGALSAITVREMPRVLDQIDSLIRLNDRPRDIIRLRFQLIGAEDVALHEPAVAAIDSTLRSLFHFAGYRLLSEGIATAGDHEGFSLTFAAGDERFALRGSVSATRAEEQGGHVRILIGMSRAGMPGETLLSTGVTIPPGHPIVLGSAAPGGKVKALILVVHPELLRGVRP